MLTTRTGGFNVGFRQGWSPWFKQADTLIEWSLKNGFSVIDIGGDFVSELPKLVGRGISIGSADLLHWNDLISENPDDQKRALEANKALFAAFAPHGVTNYFAVMLPKDPSKPRSENFGLMLDSLNKLAELLKQYNGKLVIEGWPGNGALCCTPEGYRACLDQTPAEIGINFDPSHLIRMGIDPVRFAKEFASRIYHMHGKDCIMNADDLYNFGWEQPATFAKSHDFGSAMWRYTIPGHGTTPWSLIFSILKDSGYRGAVSIELEDENFNGTEEGEKAGLILGGSILASS